MTIDERLNQLGLTLPQGPSMPLEMRISFRWVRVVGQRLLVSGHGAQLPDGTPKGPFGRVPDVVTLEEAEESARGAALSVMSSVRQAIGDLDRVDAWVTVSGFVNAIPGYPRTTTVLNAFSEVVLDVFGDQIGGHARTAIGVDALPLNLPVVVAAELHVAGIV